MTIRSRALIEASAIESWDTSAGQPARYAGRYSTSSLVLNGSSPRAIFLDMV